MIESFKRVPFDGFEHYEVSNLGNVRGPKGLMRSRASKRGYLKIGLRHIESKIQKTFNVHRLVALTFVDGHKSGLVVNHIDGDKTNNCSDNLEWVTQSENMKHAYKTGLQEVTSEQLCRLRQFAKNKRRVIRVVNHGLGIDEVFSSVSEAGEKLPCSEKTIRNSLTKKHKSRLGYEAYYLGGDARV